MGLPKHTPFKGKQTFPSFLSFFRVVHRETSKHAQIPAQLLKIISQTTNGQHVLNDSGVHL